MNNTVCSLMITYGISVPVLAYIYLKFKNKANSIITCRLIIITGMLLRILYIFYTNVYTRQHDVEDFSLSDDGHAAYILYLLQNKHLPDFDPRYAWQFYHPPLHHIISAAFLSVIGKFNIPLDTVGYELLQVLPCLYSVLFCILAYKSLKLLGIKDRPLCFATAFVTFHPTLIMLSGSINNDMLAAVLSMSSIYFLIKWSLNKRMSDIILTALSIGLGMEAKLNAALTAPAAAAVFLYVFIKNIKDFRRLITQYIVFGFVCVPIGLFWSVRNYIKFGVPANYVPKLSADSDQYIGTGILSRLLDFSPYQFSSPFMQWRGDGAPYNEFNPITALWKTAAFDGNTYFENSVVLQSFCCMLLFCLIILSCYSAYLLIAVFIKRSPILPEHKLMTAVLSLTLFINYIVFCADYPHVCTQNMRYCVPLIFTQAVLFGCDDHSKLKETAIFIFCVSSLTVYTVLQFF